MSKNTCYHCWNAISKIDLIGYDIFGLGLNLNKDEFKFINNFFKTYNCELICFSIYHYIKMFKLKNNYENNFCFVYKYDYDYDYEMDSDYLMKIAHPITINSICCEFCKVEQL